MDQNPLIRYSAPTKYDQYPMGTRCKVIHTLSADYELYEQISPDETNPIWYLNEKYKKNL